MLDRRTDRTPVYTFGLLLLPNFSMLAFAAAIETLRMANRLAGETLYAWHTLSVDQSAIAASNGIEITPDASIGDPPPLDAAIVCSGIDVERSYSKAHLFWLKKFANRNLPVGALCTGTYLLAKADLLDGYRCTIHWENMASLREEFPNIVVSAEVFEIDRKRYSCAGGTAALDLFLNLIIEQHGKGAWQPPSRSSSSATASAASTTVSGCRCACTSAPASPS